VGGEERGVEHLGGGVPVAPDLYHLGAARQLITEGLLVIGLDRRNRKPGAVDARRLQDLDTGRDLKRPPGAGPRREFRLLGVGRRGEACDSRGGGRRRERGGSLQETASIHRAISLSSVLIIR